MVAWAMVACGQCAPHDTGCVSCTCLAAQHGARVLKVVNCHETPCKSVCQWLDAYWLGLSQGCFTDGRLQACTCCRPAHFVPAKPPAWTLPLQELAFPIS